MDKKARDLQNTIFKLNVPKQVTFSPPEFDTGVTKLSDAMDELQSPLINDWSSVSKALVRWFWVCEEEAATEDVEAMEGLDVGKEIVRCG